MFIKAGGGGEKNYTAKEWFAMQYQSERCMSQVFTVPWGKLYKASLYDGIVYPEDRPVEDDFTTWKFYLMVDKIAYMNESLYVHRKRKASVTGEVNPIYTYPLLSVANSKTAFCKQAISKAIRTCSCKKNG
ncbi:hypothetical protein [Streptococcus merionis]|uniref:hypothetical protein n=1 Tax=Streptococcus merionis TaxID=400065 RepID=UPI0026EF5873|nr:hypothetical protein [Streptococcus merionis]